jgi:hypothetical protein
LLGIPDHGYAIATNNSSRMVVVRCASTVMAGLGPEGPFETGHDGSPG